MLRSTSTKLKAFLIIDLILFGAFTGTYFYVQGQIPVASGSKPAEFVLSNMVIDPSEVYSGQAVVISLNTTNVGDLEGNQTLNLEINGVVKDTQNVTVEGGESQVVQFTYIDTEVGNYSVKVGSLAGSFVINPAPPDTSKIILSNLLVNPYEVWQNDTVTLSATAQNRQSYTDNLTVKVEIDGAVVQTQVVFVPAQTTQTVTFNVTAIGGEGQHSIKVNTLSGSYTIVKTGFHTLVISRSGSGSQPLPVTVDGNSAYTHYRQLLPVGEHTISVPDPYNYKTAIFTFSSWNDGVKKATRTIDLEALTILVTSYTLISGFASCPTLFVWDGTGYTRASEVSDGPGWLGNVKYYNADGSIVFDYSNPWSYIKLNPTLMRPANGYYDMTITEQSDEIFYLDSVKLLAVDHSPNVDVYSTRGTYIYNLSQSGTIYTVGKNLATPVSATNNGVNALPQISALDQNYTTATRWSWNTLELNLGNLAGAQQIKLVVNAVTKWPTNQQGGNWATPFSGQPGTTPSPPPYMEVKDANGNWIRVADDRQFPIPPVDPSTFVVNLTGIFPTNNYSLRINYFQDYVFDYIGIDTTAQQTINIQEISPASASLSQAFATYSNSTGNFTRYGDVSALIQNADDMYVVGRQGDSVDLKFQDQTPIAEGMVRDYFVVVSVWFKGQGLPYVPFTVNPLPFHSMSGYLYPSNENYPNDAAHQAYLTEYNTRAFTIDNIQKQGIAISGVQLLLYASVASAIFAVCDVAVIVVRRKKLSQVLKRYPNNLV